MRVAPSDAPRMATDRGESSGVRPAKRDTPAGVAVGIGLGVPSSSWGAIGRPRVLPVSLALVATCRKKAGVAGAGRLGEGGDRVGLVRENADSGVGAGGAGGSGFMG